MKKVNKLVHIAEFDRLLKTYRPHEDTLEMLRKTPLVLLVGPTASGRNTLIHLLIDTNRYHYIVSNTTRQPRENNGIMEQDGREYWFVTEEEFLEGLQEGRYLEAAIIHGQQVSGIGVAELERAWQSGRIAIDEIEVEGARTIRKYKPDTLFIFLLPPTFEVWMQRLKGRGHMPEDELVRRLKSARDEITEALEEDFYHFVINNDIHEATVAVDELANGRQPDTEKQRLGRDHAEQLVIDIKYYLSTAETV